MQAHTTSRHLACLCILAGAVVHCGDDTATTTLDASLTSGDSAVGSCEVGTVGCACDDDFCLDGECVESECVDCRRGEAGCVCMSNGACESGLHCEEALCVRCEEGEGACPCAVAGCEDGMACKNDVCVEADCEPGEDECACLDDTPECGDGSYCDDNGMCRRCATDVPDCPCDDEGRCRGGLACEDDHCVMVMTAPTCEELFDNGTCTPHQLCDDRAEGGPVCTPETCERGYRWEDDECRECETRDCSEPSKPSCDDDDPDSVAAGCAEASRVCTDTDEGPRCGDCLAGLMEKDGECVRPIQCGGGTCEDTEYCDRDAGECKELPCEAGQALSRSGSCAACPRCEGRGLTGRSWPFQNDEGECICETLEGYFMPTASNSLAQPCDADGDGWVRKEADDAKVREDDAHRQNARCQVLSVDGVVLVDEYGVELEVGSCSPTEGLVKDPSEETCSQRLPLRLLETPRNDTPGFEHDKAPPYEHLAGVGDGGRRLEASELTSLTKACVTSNADYNDDGRSDLGEEQRGVAPQAAPLDQQRLRSFSYFTELYRGAYRAGSDGRPAKFVIAERSRCDADFPLHYGGGASHVTIPDGPNPGYWRSCTRRRDADFDADGTGYDFAQWTCDATTGSCAASPPAHPEHDASTFTSKDKLVRGHGLCELEGQPPADGLWRGMGHHSQFKCVQVSGTATSPDAGRYHRDEFVAPRAPEQPRPPAMVLNLCEARGSAPAAAGSGSDAPEISCAAHDPSKAVPAGVTVGWAAVNFIDYGDYRVQGQERPGDNNGDPGVDYQRGCISEDAEYGPTWLCPYPSFVLDKPRRDDSFGRYSCGEDQNFLWAGDGNDNEAATLWWDGENAAGARSVLR